MPSAAIAAPTSPLNAPQPLPTATAARPEVVTTGAPSAMPVDEEGSVPILGALPGLLRDAPGTLLDLVFPASAARPANQNDLATNTVINSITIEDPEESAS